MNVMEMTYFGQRHASKLYEQIQRVPTPLGCKCMHCEEEIQMGEDGFLDSILNPFHRECWVRTVIGSVAHQKGVCSCFKGAAGVHDDSSHLTRRQAAQLALAHFERHWR